MPNTTTLQSGPITEAQARKLTTAVEIISEDLQAPIEVKPRFDPDTDQIIRIGIRIDLPYASRAAGSNISQAADSIADQLDIWSTRLQRVAHAIRTRYPK